MADGQTLGVCWWPPTPLNILTNRLYALTPYPYKSNVSLDCTIRATSEHRVLYWSSPPNVTIAIPFTITLLQHILSIHIYYSVHKSNKLWTRWDILFFHQRAKWTVTCTSPLSPRVFHFQIQNRSRAFKCQIVIFLLWINIYSFLSIMYV